MILPTLLYLFIFYVYLFNSLSLKTVIIIIIILDFNKSHFLTLFNFSTSNDKTVYFE